MTRVFTLHFSSLFCLFWFSVHYYCTLFVSIVFMQIVSANFNNIFLFFRAFNQELCPFLFQLWPPYLWVPNTGHLKITCTTAYSWAESQIHDRLSRYLRRYKYWENPPHTVSICVTTPWGRIFCTKQNASFASKKNIFVTDLFVYYIFTAKSLHRFKWNSVCKNFDSWETN